jgi:hypothetical protein
MLRGELQGVEDAHHFIEVPTWAEHTMRWSGWSRAPAPPIPSSWRDW